MQYWEKLLAAREPASAMEAGQLLAAGKLFMDSREAGLEAPTAGAEADEPDDTLRRPEGTAEWATTEPEEDEYLQYFDWDRFEYGLPVICPCNYRPVITGVITCNYSPPFPVTSHW